MMPRDASCTSDRRHFSSIHAPCLEDPLMPRLLGEVSEKVQFEGTFVSRDNMPCSASIAAIRTFQYQKCAAAKMVSIRILSSQMQKIYAPIIPGKSIL